jgi:putative aldouronate transport system permease protein
MNGTIESRLFSIVNVTLLTIIGLVTLFPLYYVFVVSFTDPSEYYKNPYVIFPKNWSFESYAFLLGTSTFVRSIGVSLFLSTVGTALSLVITATISYALSIQRFQGRRFILLAILLTTIIQPGIIPNYLLVREIGLINSVWSLIIPVLTGGWYVLLMKGFFDSIPQSLEEAARIDGCQDFDVWWRIVLPLSLPALAAFGLFFAVQYWNTFFHAILYINDHSKWPLQVILRNMLIDAAASEVGGGAVEQRLPTETLKMAAVVIGTVPILLVYPFLQKHFAKGAMVGSVKG